MRATIKNSMNTTKFSPIYEIAKQMGAKFIDQGNWQVAERFGAVEQETAVAQQSVAISDQTGNGRIRIEGNSAGKMLEGDGLAIGASQEMAYGNLYRLRQDLFFVCTEMGMNEETAVQLNKQAQNSNDLITVTDVSHGTAELWLVGPQSPDLLSRLCGLDFHDNQFPNKTAKQSSVAKTKQLIIRQDMENSTAYALIGSRSLAAYLWETILEAGKDLGIQAIGMTAFAVLQK